MILQNLYRDADAILSQTSKDGKGGLPPSMYMKKRVKWIIDLFTDPRYPAGYCEFQPTPGDDKKGVEQPVPFVKRTAGVRPLLLADKTSYTLGLRIADTKRDVGRDLALDAARTKEEHSAYKQLIRECAEKTDDVAVKRIADFLDTWDPANPSPDTPTELGRDDLFTFRVDGKKPIDIPAVQKFWADYIAGTGGDTETEEGAGEAEGEPVRQCLISEAHTIVEEMMPVPVKGLPGGKSEMAIVSANAAAFESYGLKRAQTSPISREAGERFGQALNALIASESHRVTGGNVVYIFWARGGKVKLPAFSPPPDSRTVRQFITAVWRGDTSWADNLPKTEKFHLYGLTANVARVVVRTAIETDIDTIGKHQATWFQGLEIVGSDGAPGKPIPMWALQAAAYRESKDTPASVADSLVQAAFDGKELPASLFQTLVMRCRAGTTIGNRRVLVSYERAALFKYLLIQKGIPVMPELDPENQSPAYRCGRLLAQLEYIQYRAQGKLNATLVDRYFGAASTTPRIVFPTLVRMANQAHLPKIRKKNVGTFLYLQDELAQIQAPIGGQYPPHLKLLQQGEFALGYYFQRAEIYKKREDADEADEAEAVTEGESE